MRTLRSSITALTAAVALGISVGASTASAEPTMPDPGSVVSPTETPLPASAPFWLGTTAATSPTAPSGQDLPVAITVGSSCLSTSLPHDCSGINVTLSYQNMSSGQWGQLSGELPGAGGTIVLTIPGADVQTMGLSYQARATQSCGDVLVTSAAGAGSDGVVLVIA